MSSSESSLLPSWLPSSLESSESSLESSSGPLSLGLGGFSAALVICLSTAKYSLALAGSDDDSSDDSENSSDDGSHEGSSDDSEEDIENTPSHKHLTKCYKAINGVAGQIQKMAAQNEHPIAKAHLQETQEQLEGMAGETAKCYSKCFDGKEIAKDDDGGDGDGMEKWLATTSPL